MFVKGDRRIVCDVRSILLVQLGDVGDLVLSFPCVRALREHFPAAKIMLAVREKSGDLVELCPWADGAILVSTEKRWLWEQISFQLKFFAGLRRHQFDLVIDLRTGTRGAFIAFLSGARQRIGYYFPLWWRNLLFTDLYDLPYSPGGHVSRHLLDILTAYGLKTEHPIPEFVVPDSKQTAAAEILREAGVDPNGPLPVALQPFSLWQYKEWGEQKYVQLIRHIRDCWQLPVIVTGAPGEQSRAQAIVDAVGGGVFNLAGKTTLSEYGAVLKFCRLFVGVDSAGQHLAAAVGVPTVILYGPSSPVSWAPCGPQHLVVQKAMPCVPCRQTGCGGDGKSRCLDELAIEEVMPSIEQQLRLTTSG
ncbi:MAG: glycosyltransferase family 9 protein [Desulfobulbaceae bacterium]|nr:glycosyltransferase family 9 protein [Desulfobulbaceae bacterium]HIJ91746.1 glycosyltransferase family 9 protein [Deltaproteobacteria bacterium]